MSVLKDLNTKTVNIDVLKGTTEKIVFNQHETTGTIRFQFKNGTDTFNLSAINSIRAYLLKPDNTKCFVDLEIENALAGTAIMNLTNNILAKPGKIICNLILKEGETDNKFTTKFAITCKDVEYDEVLRRQREVIYKQRNDILVLDDMEPVVKKMMASVTNRHVSKYGKCTAIDDDTIFVTCSKAIKPSDEEIKINPRSRSAKMRFAVKKDKTQKEQN